MVKLSEHSQPLMCPSGWQKLLLCTDGSPRSQEALKATLALAQAGEHKVYAVNALRVRAEVEAVAPDARAMLAREEEAGKIQPDLNVMGRFGQIGLSQLFMGSDLPPKT